MAQQQYETMFIISPLEKDKEVKKVAKSYAKFLEKEGAEFVNKEEWGHQKFAFPIQKYNGGYYFIFEYKADTQVPQKLETEFNRDQRVLRDMTVRLDKYAIEYNERRRKKGPRTSQKKDKKDKKKGKKGKKKKS